MTHGITMFAQFQIGLIHSDNVEDSGIDILGGVLIYYMELCCCKVRR